MKMMTLWQEICADVSSSAPFLFRLLISSVCGALIGLERSKRQKDAGIRTHILVSLGATLIMIVSKEGFYDVLTHPSISLDPSRLASNVITGISFLGAGVIFVKNLSIRGLTTAAGIWATAGVGLAIGAGMYTIGVVAMLYMLLFQFILHRFFTRLENTSNEFTVMLVNSPAAVKEFKAILASRNIAIQSLKMEKNSGSTMTLTLLIKKSRTITMDEIFLMIEQNENVIEVDI